MKIDAGGLAQDVSALLDIHASERLGYNESVQLCNRVVARTITHADTHGDMAHQLMGGLTRLYKAVLADLPTGLLDSEETAYLHDLLCAAGRHHLRIGFRAALTGGNS